MRRAHARPGGGVVYDLTDFGRELEQPIMRLGFWGAKAMGPMHDGDHFSIDSLALALARLVPPRARRRAGAALRVQGRRQVAAGGVSTTASVVAPSRLDRRARSRDRGRRRRARRTADRTDRPRDGTEDRPDEARGYAAERHADCSRCSGFLPHRTDRQGLTAPAVGCPSGRGGPAPVGELMGRRDHASART